MTRIASAIVLFSLTAGCGSDAVPSARTGDPQWVQAIRAGKMPDSLDLDAASSWLEKNLIKGQSSRADVTQAFGEPARSGAIGPAALDRPQRDGVDVYQYDLWDGHDGVNWGRLVVHYDSQTQILVDWELSSSMCGFCPHVFADDGRWRLEGKMLAGCVGKQRTGTDTLLLPRLIDRDGSLSVRLANLAPETDYVTDASLAAVPLGDDEELDVSAMGNLVVWKPLREFPVALTPVADGASVATVNLAAGTGSDVLVFEMRNTFAFETAMRGLFLEGREPTHRPELTIDFGDGKCSIIQPVGTKFLRRIVVTIPERSTRVTIRAEGDFWYTRRLWVGTLRSCDLDSAWHHPLNPYSQRLSPMQETVLVFPGPVRAVSSSQRYGYALRIRGHYDFLEIRR